MLKRDQSLKGKKRFEKIYQTIRPLRFDYLKIRSLAIPGEARGPKIGLVISTKISKKAVERNRLKRQLRAILREKIDGGELVSQEVIINVYKKPDLSQSFELLKQDVDRWLKK